MPQFTDEERQVIHDYEATIRRIDAEMTEAMELGAQRKGVRRLLNRVPATLHRNSMWPGTVGRRRQDEPAANAHSQEG